MRKVYAALAGWLIKRHGLTGLDVMFNSAKFWRVTAEMTDGRMYWFRAREVRIQFSPPTSSETSTACDPLPVPGGPTSGPPSGSATT